MVTVTDKWGLTSSVSINVDTSIWLGPPSVGVARGPQVCKNTTFILAAVYAGGGGLYTYKWSTGATTESITSNTLGSYGDSN